MIYASEYPFKIVNLDEVMAQRDLRIS